MFAFVLGVRKSFSHDWTHLITDSCLTTLFIALVTQKTSNNMFYKLHYGSDLLLILQVQNQNQNSFIRSPKRGHFCVFAHCYVIYHHVFCCAYQQLELMKRLWVRQRIIRNLDMFFLHAVSGRCSCPARDLIITRILVCMRSNSALLGLRLLWLLTPRGLHWSCE